MKAIYLLVAVCVLSSCTPLHTFEATSETAFEAYPEDHPIDYYPEAPPDRPYVVVGIAECRGERISGVLPYLKELARENGADAIIDMQSTQVFAACSNYRVTCIRYETEKED